MNSLEGDLSVSVGGWGVDTVSRPESYNERESERAEDNEGKGERASGSPGGEECTDPDDKCFSGQRNARSPSEILGFRIQQVVPRVRWVNSSAAGEVFAKPLTGSYGPDRRKEGAILAAAGRGVFSEGRLCAKQPGG